MDKINVFKFNKKKLISEKYMDSYKDRYLVSIRWNVWKVNVLDFGLRGLVMSWIRLYCVFSLM